MIAKILGVLMLMTAIFFGINAIYLYGDWLLAQFLNRASMSGAYEIILAIFAAALNFLFLAIALFLVSRGDGSWKLKLWGWRIAITMEILIFGGSMGMLAHFAGGPYFLTGYLFAPIGSGLFLFILVLTPIKRVFKPI